MRKPDRINSLSASNSASWKKEKKRNQGVSKMCLWRAKPESREPCRKPRQGSRRKSHQARFPRCRTRIPFAISSTITLGISVVLPVSSSRISVIHILGTYSPARSAVFRARRARAYVLCHSISRLGWLWSSGEMNQQQQPRVRNTMVAPRTVDPQDRTNRVDGRHVASRLRSGRGWQWMAEDGRGETQTAGSRINVEYCRRTSNQNPYPAEESWLWSSSESRRWIAAKSQLRTIPPIARTTYTPTSTAVCLVLRSSGCRRAPSNSLPTPFGVAVLSRWRPKKKCRTWPLGNQPGNIDG